MNDHLDKYLCKKYPKIFVDRNKPMTESCMYWGFPGDGWFFILDAACSQIQRHIDHPPYVNKRGNSIKQLYNLTLWNWIFYPIARLVAFGKFPNRKIIISNDKYSKCQWAVYNWFSKWFQFDIRYKPGKPIPQVVATQVKEKFGTLRFYIHGGDEYTAGIVDFAEALSHYVCENCGRMDETVGRNPDDWIKTTCEKCTQKDYLSGHIKNRDKKMVEMWNKVRNESK